MRRGRNPTSQTTIVNIDDRNTARKGTANIANGNKFKDNTYDGGNMKDEYGNMTNKGMMNSNEYGNSEYEGMENKGMMNSNMMNSNMAKGESGYGWGIGTVVAAIIIFIIIVIILIGIFACFDIDSFKHRDGKCSKSRDWCKIVGVAIAVAVVIFFIIALLYALFRGVRRY